MREESELIAESLRARAPQRGLERREGAAHGISLAEIGASGGAEGGEVFETFMDLLCRERPILLKDLMDRIEKDIIVRSLRMAGGNQKQAAGILGIKYTTLHEKLKKFGIRFRKTPVDLAF